MAGYPFKDIEAKWQTYWETHGTFRVGADIDMSRPKYYALDMFPYPSGDGLHVGHPEGYTACDIVARYKRMRGFNVLHPMGWDAFGLPAEQYALKTGTHPKLTTERNVRRFREQRKTLGFSYDWQREVNTTDPGYYRWTQWIFKQLFERGLAYQEQLPVWWCPELGTTLANEEVIDGKSEVGGFPCVRRLLRQWVLKITAYADALLEGLEGLDWPESTKEMQRHWIGRSEGAEIEFAIHGHPDLTLRVFTTRPDTLEFRQGDVRRDMMMSVLHDFITVGSAQVLCLTLLIVFLLASKVPSRGRLLASIYANLALTLAMFGLFLLVNL